MVDVAHWRVSDVLSSRRSRLLQPPDPIALLGKAKAESESAARKGEIKLVWQPADEFPGFSRAEAKVPLEEDTFDQLFNGRSGYRAQYYLSPEEGVLYNHDLLTTLAPALEQAFLAACLAVDWELVRRSLAGPHAKVWVFEEKKAFDEAIPESLNPDRWVENCATRSRRAPLPHHRSIDIKGVFLHPESLEFRVDDYKLDRACDIFNKGYT
jgi:hypothetical protein